MSILKRVFLSPRGSLVAGVLRNRPLSGTASAQRRAQLGLQDHVSLGCRGPEGRGWGRGEGLEKDRLGGVTAQSRDAKRSTGNEVDNTVTALRGARRVLEADFAKCGIVYPLRCTPVSDTK